MYCARPWNENNMYIKRSFDILLLILQYNYIVCLYDSCFLCAYILSVEALVPEIDVPYFAGRL